MRRRSDCCDPAVRSIVRFGVIFHAPKGAPGWLIDYWVEMTMHPPTREMAPAGESRRKGMAVVG